MWCRLALVTTIMHPDGSAYITQMSDFSKAFVNQLVDLLAVGLSRGLRFAKRKRLPSKKLCRAPRSNEPRNCANRLTSRLDSRRRAEELIGYLLPLDRCVNRIRCRN